MRNTPIPIRTIIKTVWIALGVVLALLVGGPANAEAGAKLKADYKFKDNYKSSVHGAPSLKKIGGGFRFAKEKVPGKGKTKVLKFKKGRGLGLNTKRLLPALKYSVILEFRMSEIGAGNDTYMRILNPTVRAENNDNGLYIFENVIDYWDDGADNLGTKTLKPHRYFEIAFTRAKDGSTHVYVNGKLDLGFSDNSTGDGEIRDHLLRFFEDDGSEESAGAVARIRAYNGELSTSKVRKIYNKGH